MTCAKLAYSSCYAEMYENIYVEHTNRTCTITRKLKYKTCYVYCMKKKGSTKTAAHNF